MGKATGFLDFQRRANTAEPPLERLAHFNEFHTPMDGAERRAQAARCMECGVPFCQAAAVLGGMVSGCPLHNLIPEWNDLIYSGDLQHAFARLRKTSNFPEFTGRVCPALCEVACTNGVNGEATAIKENELYLIETAWENGWMTPRPPKVRSGKTVAVVGSGPSGLACADQLNHRGHTVTVFEREDRIGGLLMYGIPNMKLEKRVIDRRVNLMREEGVRFETSVDVGKDRSAASLLEEFDAVVLCCGASNPRDLQVQGREANGVYFAVDFLKSTTKSLLNSNLEDHCYIDSKGKHVIIIGGGDTGNDCVGTCLRHGCASVKQLEMMPKAPDTRAENNPWPEWPRISKTDYGQEEAIAVTGADPRIYQTTVTELFSDEAGNLKSVKTVQLGKDLKPIEGTEQVMECDILLIAAGFLGCQSYVAQAFGVALTPRTVVETEAGKYAASVPGVFTAGDMHRGQSLVVWAINEGRAAAREVDEYLMGYTNLA
ncbi:MAG: glutamate synthase subunit beta [Oscillospiraceae bacterium]|nr:glutamate synthase subunit beta [Oscillospiraceae bacterium]